MSRRTSKPEPTSRPPKLRWRRGELPGGLPIAGLPVDELLSWWDALHQLEMSMIHLSNLPRMKGAASDDAITVLQEHSYQTCRLLYEQMVAALPNYSEYDRRFALELALKQSATTDDPSVAAQVMLMLAKCAVQENVS